MKLDSVKVFLVNNPPPSFGGRYFVFLKLKTACGIEGVGEVYAATFGPKVVAKMIEDLFARRFHGRDPFQIESLWRESYGSGFSLRPDLSLMGVISGLEMACWDIIGKAVEQPIYNLLGGKVNERLRSYTYLYPAAGEGDDFYHDADRSAARAAEYVAQGFTGLKFDPTGGFSAYDPRQATQEQLERTVRLVRLVREAVGRRADLLIGTAWPIHDFRCHSLSKATRALRSPVVRRARAARDAGTNGDRGARHLHSDCHRRTPHHQVRIRACLGKRRGQYHSNEPRPGGRPAGGEKGGGLGGGALRANCAASVLRPGGGRREYSDRRVLAEFLDSREHPAVGWNSRRTSAQADSLGTRLCHSADVAPASGSNSTKPWRAPVPMSMTARCIWK